MSAAATCPHCGTPVHSTNGAGGSAQATAIDTLSQEVEGLREFAETRWRDTRDERIQALTREVEHLRQTVARLRGASAGAPAPAHSAPGSAPSSPSGPPPSPAHL